ncbi:hypothetical protein ACGFNU_26015 [Spirillospora sp. NPDC048911]|uniref:hypothetical protein n=1 Tax=Spirillospora sp. NPDC048911 TaxID=3364527 RepID=UPI00371AE944
MDPTNRHYGHAHVFARYCGLTRSLNAGPPPPRIAGMVQHGWTFVHGFGAGHKVVNGYPKFVWSDVVLRRGRALGWRDFCVIGAPWNYLQALQPDASEPVDRERSGTLWYPFHGWDRNELNGDHRRLIDEIKATEPGPVTVCLYWLEHRRRRVRRAYEKAGFRVICHGPRDDNPEFLPRQLAELRKHRRVASNRLTTAVFYGVSAGCEPAVYGDPMLMERVSPLYEGKDLVPRLYPELHGTDVDLATAREITATELGADQLVPPDELRLLFRWPEHTEDAR